MRKPNMKIEGLMPFLTMMMIFSASTWAQEGVPSEEHLSEIYKGKAYSPYVGRTFKALPLWGDTHLHTSLSFDAGAFGNRLAPREDGAFRRPRRPR